jgi:hypothetical protein
MNAGTPPETVIISSASSKTALATAHGLQRREIKTIGLTSGGNAAFVADTELYTHVMTYDQVGALSPEAPAAYVDFAGRPALTAAVHKACGSALVRSMIIGMTDWEADRNAPAGLTGPEPEFFFVPTYAAERAKELGATLLNEMTQADMLAFYPVSRQFVTPETVRGQQAISDAWSGTLAGNVRPDQGLICQL